MTARRDFGRRALGLSAAAAAAAVGFPAPLRSQAVGRVVVVGGGAGGVTCARHLAKDGAGALAVTLVEEQRSYTTCFYSNLYLAGWRDLESITHGYDRLSGEGVELVHARAVAIDPAARTVALLGGGALPYDRLVVAPGIDFKPGAIEGYDPYGPAAQRMPHAWKGGAQTRLLRDQLRAMPDGGVLVIAAPPNPYRCPPAPYERACCAASYLKVAKPRSKVLILDAKDKFSKQDLFAEAWNRHYAGMVDWTPAGFGGEVVAVDPEAMTLTTADGEVHGADVANVVPAQTAGRIALEAGLADDSGFCPIAAESMRSVKDPNIHVLGDAAIAGDMPKSAFAANSQAKVAAMAIRADLTGSRAFPARYRNACWSSLAPDDAVRIGSGYEPRNGRITSVDPFVSKPGESADLRRRTRAEADAWYESFTADVFG